jgi:hypothetical protein
MNRLSITAADLSDSKAVAIADVESAYVVTATRFQDS